MKLTDGTDASSHTNYRFLSTPEKVSRMWDLRKHNKALTAQLKKIQVKLEASIEANGVILDDETCHDMKRIMEDEDQTISEKYPEDSFQYIFWKQQKECLLKEGNQKKGI